MRPFRTEIAALEGESAQFTSVDVNLDHRLSHSLGKTACTCR
jgi:hypothetical protein